MPKLSVNQKLGIYGITSLSVYFLYQHLKVYELYTHLKTKINDVNEEYFGDFPLLPQIYQSLDNGIYDWSSEHFHKRDQEFKSGDRDIQDPLNYTHFRGSSSARYKLLNGGILQLTNATSPRLYINTDLSGDFDNPVYKHKYKNVEITWYYKKLNNDQGYAYGGSTCGIRSGSQGHAAKYITPSRNARLVKPPDNDTDLLNYKINITNKTGLPYDEAHYENAKSFLNAHTYYFKWRTDGRLGLNKELHHAAPSNEINLWPDGGTRQFPRNTFFGNKFICFNFIDEITNEEKVRLEYWIDTKSNGDRRYVNDKSNWEKIAEFTDSYGAFPCKRHEKFTHHAINQGLTGTYITPQIDPNNFGTTPTPVINDNWDDKFNPFKTFNEGGIVLFRESSADFQLKYIQAREIIPPTIKSLPTPSKPRFWKYQEINDTTIKMYWTEPEFTDITNKNADAVITAYKMGGPKTRIFGNINEFRMTGLRKFKRNSLGEQDASLGYEEYAFSLRAKNNIIDEYGDPIPLLIKRGEVLEGTNNPSQPLNIRAGLLITSEPDINKWRTRIAWDRPLYSDRTIQANTSEIYQYSIQEAKGSEKTTDYLTEYVDFVLSNADPDRIYSFSVSASNNNARDNYGEKAVISFKLTDLSSVGTEFGKEEDVFVPTDNVGAPSVSEISFINVKDSNNVLYTYGVFVAINPPSREETRNVIGYTSGGFDYICEITFRNASGSISTGNTRYITNDNTIGGSFRINALKASTPYILKIRAKPTGTNDSKYSVPLYVGIQMPDDVYELPPIYDFIIPDNLLFNPINENDFPITSFL